MIRIGLDSNILAYFAGVSQAQADDEKIESVRSTLDVLTRTATLIAPVQALGELFIVLRRSGATAPAARVILLEFATRFDTAPTGQQTAIAAADLVVDHKLQFWDALIVMAAAEAGCTLLLSEDMQHGFVARGLTVVNPLAEKPHPKLASLLTG